MIKNAILRTSVAASLATAAVVATALPSAAADVRPNPSPSLPADLQNKMDTGLSLFMGVVLFACVLGVLIVAALLAVAARRGALEDHMGRLGAVMAACILLGGASSLVMFLV